MALSGAVSPWQSSPLLAPSGSEPDSADHEGGPADLFIGPVDGRASLGDMLVAAMGFDDGDDDSCNGLNGRLFPDETGEPDRSHDAEEPSPQTGEGASDPLEISPEDGRRKLSIPGEETTGEDETAPLEFNQEEEAADQDMSDPEGSAGSGVSPETTSPSATSSSFMAQVAAGAAHWRETNEMALAAPFSAAVGSPLQVLGARAFSGVTPRPGRTMKLP